MRNRPRMYIVLIYNPTQETAKMHSKVFLRNVLVLPETGFVIHGVRWRLFQERAF